MSKIKNYTHLSKELRDYWFKELISRRDGDFKASKQRVKHEIRMNYLDYMRIMADRRSQLLDAQTKMVVNMARATLNVNQLAIATKEFNSFINDLAFIAQLTFSVCKLIKPAIAVSTAVRNAIDNKELVRESLKYWPGVNQYRAVWRIDEKDMVKNALIDLGKKAAVEFGIEILTHFINEVTHLFEPSTWARGLSDVNPEAEFMQQLKQIEKARKTAEDVIGENIKRLDAQIIKAQKEMDELVEYIEACEVMV